MREAQIRIRKAHPRGASIVEAAVVLPIVLIFLMGILEYGRYVMAVQVLTNAAREGAQYAVCHTEPFTMQGTTYGNATLDVQNTVQKYTGGQHLANQNIQVFKSDVQGNNLGPWIDAASGEPICVRITGTYNFMLPSLLSLPTGMNVSIQSIMRSEGN